MELLRRNAHLAAEAELPAVGEAGGDVDVHRRAVDLVDKAVGRGLVLGHDAIAVVRRVMLDMRDGRIQIIYDRDGENVIEKFRVEVELRCRRAGNDLRRGFVEPQLDGDKARFSTLVDKRGLELGEKFLCNVAVDKADLLRVADGRAARLGVFDDLYRHVEVSVPVDVHMADARAGLDAGNACIFHARADEPLAAAGDQQVDKAVRRHQYLRARMRCILNDVDNVGIAADGLNARLERRDDGVRGAIGLLAAAQHADVAALDAQRRGVRRDVRAALVDDGDQTERHLPLGDGHTIGALELRERAAHVVGQRRGLADALGHRVDAALRQGETVEHHVGDRALRRLHVLGIFAQDIFAVGLKALRHREQQPVLLLGACAADAAPGSFCAFQKFDRCHASSLFAKNLVPTRLPAATS